MKYSFNPVLNYFYSFDGVGGWELGGYDYNEFKIFLDVEGRF